MDETRSRPKKQTPTHPASEARSRRDRARSDLERLERKFVTAIGRALRGSDPAHAACAPRIAAAVAAQASRLLTERPVMSLPLQSTELLSARDRAIVLEHALGAAASYDRDFCHFAGSLMLATLVGVLEAVAPPERHAPDGDPVRRSAPPRRARRGRRTGRPASSRPVPYRP